MSASPKRPSLDERLEKELGIKMQPDFSRPPPGYLPVPLQHQQQQQQDPFGAHQLPPPPKPGFNVLPPPPQHHQLIQQQQQQPQQPQPLPPTLAQPPPRDAPEEGRLVRVGNMLQIVPDEEGEAAAAPVHEAAAAPVPAPAAPDAVNPETDAQALMRKMEEMKRKKGPFIYMTSTELLRLFDPLLAKMYIQGGPAL